MDAGAQRPAEGSRQVTTDQTRMVIDGVEIGSDAPPYVIAEMSANHNGDLSRARELFEAA